MAKGSCLKKQRGKRQVRTGTPAVPSDVNSKHSLPDAMRWAPCGETGREGKGEAARSRSPQYNHAGKVEGNGEARGWRSRDWQRSGEKWLAGALKWPGMPKYGQNFEGVWTLNGSFADAGSLTFLI